MASQMSVLASGSRGNAAIIHANNFGLLIDFGLQPKVLNERLAACGLSWPAIRAVILTHTHGDHWNRQVFLHLLRYQILLFVHGLHHETLRDLSPEYEQLARRKLVRAYQDCRPFAVGSDLTCTPLFVRHDSYPTFAFRIDGTCPDTGGIWSLGYASDLGEPPPRLHELFREVDVLAIEFNHDVELQKASKRTAYLIERVLGPDGHLSNDQAAAWLRQHLKNHSPNLRTVVQLHLSRECNSPELAQATMDAMIREWPGLKILTAHQDIPTPLIPLMPRVRPPVAWDVHTAPSVIHQSPLPGLG